MTHSELKQALEHLDFTGSIDIDLKEVHYKNGEIIDKTHELSINYNQLASELETYFEENNYKLIKQHEIK